MKRFKYIYAIVLATLGFLTISCSKDFLEAEPTSQLSTVQIAEISEVNPAIQSSNIRGIYNTMIQIESGGLVDSHYDFGHKAYDIFSDIQSGDMVLLGLTYGWYGGMSDRTDFTDYTLSAPHYMYWRYYYRIIFAANGIINAFSNPEGTELNGEGDTPEAFEEKRHFLGQALVMRAYAYYYLMQFLTTDYTPEKPVVPIYKSSETMNNPLSTQKEVFDLIISDLTLGIGYLGDFTRANKTAVNVDVAKAFLAYTYAYMNDSESLAKAYDLSNEIISSGKYKLMTINEILYDEDTQQGGGFNDVNTSGWMWGTDLTPETGIYLISWWGQVDYYSYSYAYAGDRKGIDKELYDNMREDDKRKKQFSTKAATRWAPINKFYAPGRKPGGQGSSSPVVADYVYLRVAEMYLLNAEVAAKLGREAEAIATLKTLLADRIEDLSYLDALSGDELKKEIWMQTRIELWGEGKTLMALKRNKQTVKFGTNHLHLKGESFAYNDPTMMMMIPENEILNNPSLH